MFSGCAGKTGNEKLAELPKEQIGQQIVNGKTTKDEVKSFLGDPESIDFDPNGLEKWTYKHTRKQEKAINYVPVANWFVGGTNDTTKSLVILFDEKGVVKNHAVSEAKGETKVGLFQ